MKTALFSLLFCALLSASCASKNSNPSKVDPKEEASKNAKPGSYEDWCDEHQVPESQCTKCNPALAAAFKASNDWCEEHNLPESHCKKCNPNLTIERPPKGQ